jgi:hypothetical protein
MRFASLCLALFASALTAPAADVPSSRLPAELQTALQEFRADGPRGWNFIQTTVANGESLVEQFDATKPDFERWSLLKKNGRAPTEDELRTYREGKTRRSSGPNAPRIQDQFDLASGEEVQRDNEHVTWRFRLKPGAADDKAAGSMAAIVRFHLPTRTIDQLELLSVQPFSPVFGIHIDETHTTMTYSLPTADRPSLPVRVGLHVRGRAFWFKSLDEDMTITFSEQSRATRQH